jgi:hypothetical protein
MMVDPRTQMKCNLDYQQDTSQIHISRFETYASLSLGRKHLEVPLMTLAMQMRHVAPVAFPLTSSHFPRTPLLPLHDFLAHPLSFSVQFIIPLVHTPSPQKSQLVHAAFGITAGIFPSLQLPCSLAHAYSSSASRVQYPSGTSGSFVHVDTPSGNQTRSQFPSGRLKHGSLSM